MADEVEHMPVGLQNFPLAESLGAPLGYADITAVSWVTSDPLTSGLFDNSDGSRCICDPRMGP